MQCFSVTEKFNPFLTLNSSQNDIVKSGKDEVLKFSARNYLILPNNESWISFGDRPGKTFNLKDCTTAVLWQKLCFIWETTHYSCHGVFTDRSIFSLNLSRIQIPTGTSVTNAVMSTCRHQCRYVHMMLLCFILTESCSCRLELDYFAGKISKIRLVCKKEVALSYYESCRLLVMDS